MRWSLLVLLLVLLACNPRQPESTDIIPAPASSTPGETAPTGVVTQAGELTPEPARTPVGAPGANSQPNLPLPEDGGYVTYAVRDGEGARLFRLAISPGAVPEDLTARLEAAGPGQYTEWVNISSDASWFLVSSDRFDPDCAGWPCLVATQDFVNFETVISGSAKVHAEASAISNGGTMIVFRSGGGPHVRDLFALRREGDIWSAPVELTTPSPFAQHQEPFISVDGTKAVFACGDDPYVGTAICEADTDGSSFSVRFRAEDFAAGGEIYSPSYAPDGSIVFEGTWNGEQLWRLPTGGGEPELISGLTNDNSPCVLPGGLIVSLWLQRPGNTQGVHEIKLMAPDGTQYAMLLTGVDVIDATLGCGALR